MEMSEDILMNIFRHSLGATPRIWPTLASVCQRWRQIIFSSPLGLNIRLYCTYGTPVSKSLDYWPASLPITVEYGGSPGLDPPAPEDDDNITAALKQSGRVSSISLTITRSLLEKLSAISEPFSELEEMTVLTRDNIQLILPSTFRWGPRLTTLHSTAVAFPSCPQLLSPCQDLVDLQLHEIPIAGYFSPEEFANALSGMTQLRTVSFHFLSFPRRRSFISLPPPPGERILLPALTRLKYRGISKYLDTLAARIDAPRLGDVDIAFFSQPTMDASQLGRFIELIGLQAPLGRADAEISAHAISISFTNASTSSPLRLQIPCKQLDWQLSCMAQVCDQFSPFLFRVEVLGIDTTQSSSGQDDMAGEQWLELVRSFDGVRDFRVADKLTTEILCALGRADGGDTIQPVLPALRHLRLENPMGMNEPSWDALLSFINSRSLSGRPVQVNVPLFQCDICHASFRQQTGLDRHHVDKHAFRLMCSYCADFECTPRHNDLFREHLENEHPIATRNDPLVADPLLMSLQLDRLVDRHSSLRAPDFITSSFTSLPSVPSDFLHDTDDEYPGADVSYAIPYGLDISDLPQSVARSAPNAFPKDT